MALPHLRPGIYAGLLGDNNPSALAPFTGLTELRLQPPVVRIDSAIEQPDVLTTRH